VVLLSSSALVVPIRRRSEALAVRTVPKVPGGSSMPRWPEVFRVLPPSMIPQPLRAIFLSQRFR
jgi:hypothetical protein